KTAKPDITEEEIRQFPYKNVITRALGILADVKVDVQEASVDVGDTFLLCTEALFDVDTGRLEEIIREGGDDLERVAEALTNEVKGGQPVTLLLIHREA